MKDPHAQAMHTDKKNQEFRNWVQVLHDVGVDPTKGWSTSKHLSLLLLTRTPNLDTPATQVDVHNP